MKNFYILDEREVWWRGAIEAAQRHGYRGKRIRRGSECGEGGVGFIRTHALPDVLKLNQTDYEQMSARVTMIQDRQQVAVYENKSAQFELWGDWMPDTWRFTDLAAALGFLQYADYPIVSKADVGASSRNVRILKDRVAAVQHVHEVFGPGVVVDHCAGGPGRRQYKSKQRGYVLLQRFVPHEFTFRVNAIGDARAVFLRGCYPDRPVAQTGNVEPAWEITPEIESLLDYADRFIEHCGSKWCALDILKDGADWKLIETSLAWPWPSPGRCNDGPIFRTSHKWLGMFDVMFEEFERGAWASGSVA